MNLFENTRIAFKSKSNFELKRAHLLFEVVNIPFFVNMGAYTIPWAKHLPGVKTLVKKTIFSHFCGGETRNECLQTIDSLYQQKVGSILDYSIEGKEEEEAYDNCFREIMEIIDLAKGNPAIPFVVFKPTGFGNIAVYEKVGAGKELTADEQKQWENIRYRFYESCKKAYENDVLIMIDAEETWMQDAADELAEEMMRNFNQEKPIVLNTLQMYRHDRLAYLKSQYQKAEEGGYFLGFKVVRGAYMEKERERAKEKGYPSPIQPDKQSTDNDYNAAIAFIIEHRDRILLFAGTHNELSCFKLKEMIDTQQIDVSQKKIWFGQLLGMSDNISFVLSDLGYNVAKYVPYGPVNDVLPYLIRRAQENTSVAGQSSRELRLIEEELKRRKKEKKA